MTSVEEKIEAVKFTVWRQPPGYPLDQLIAPTRICCAKKILYVNHLEEVVMTEPKNGRPIFFPENLVLFGNIALFLWIVLDSVAFLLI